MNELMNDISSRQLAFLPTTAVKSDSYIYSRFENESNIRNRKIDQVNDWLLSLRDQPS